jgi:WD40 repeat protein
MFPVTGRGILVMCLLVAMRSAAVAQELAGHENVVAAVAFSPDGQRLVSAGWDRTARLWNLDASPPVATFSEHSDWGQAALFVTGGRQVWSASFREAVLWNADDQTVVHRWNRFGGPQVNTVVFSPDGQWLAAGERSGHVQICELSTGTVVRRLTAHEHWVSGLAFSADGAQLATADRRGAVTVWDLKTGLPRVELAGHDGSTVAGLAISRDGKLLATGSHDRSVKLWELPSGKLRSTLKGHDGLVLTVAFSPDGSWLASGDRHGYVQLWDTDSGQPGPKFAGTTAGMGFSVVALAFSPDGQQLAFGGYDKTIHLRTVANP